MQNQPKVDPRPDAIKRRVEAMRGDYYAGVRDRTSGNLGALFSMSKASV